MKEFVRRELATADQTLKDIRGDAQYWSDQGFDVSEVAERILQQGDFAPLYYDACRLFFPDIERELLRRAIIGLG